jgi:hypothetical protein
MFSWARRTSENALTIEIISEVSKALVRYRAAILEFEPSSSWTLDFCNGPERRGVIWLTHKFDDEPEAQSTQDFYCQSSLGPLCPMRNVR